MKHRSSLVAACLLACVFAAPAQAMLMNGNFDSGFDFWQGRSGVPDTTTMGLVETEYPAGALPAPIFQVAMGEATISTDLGNAIVAVTLFQEIDLSGFAPGTPLKLSMDLLGLGSLPGLSFAGLNYDCQPGLVNCTTIDVLQGATAPGTYMTDVSAAAGSQAFVTFNVGAFAGTPEAQMTVDNVSLTTMVTLPEPLTAALLLAGLAFAGRARRRTR